MKHEILPDGRLRITVDEHDRQRLIDMKQDHSGHALEGEALSELVCNSELEWLPEGSTGDLTSAPMLGITDVKEDGNGYRKAELPALRFGEVLAGGDSGGEYYSTITHRWAYMSYQVRSFVDDLIDKGECIWEGGAAE